MTRVNLKTHYLFGTHSDTTQYSCCGEADPHILSENINEVTCKACKKYYNDVISQTPKRNKYGAKKTYSELIGRTFDSKLEAERAEQLFLMEKAGKICKLEFQVPFVLSDIPKYKCKMIVDFKYFKYYNNNLTSENAGCWICEDAKGRETEAWTVRKKWLKEKYGIDVILYRG